MQINRRQILIFLGSLVGVTLGCSERKQETSNFVNIPQTEQPIQAIKVPIYAAPQGMFAPQKGDIRLVVISDLNSQYGATTYEPQVEAAMALIPQWQPDLVLCAGDMVAGQKRSLSTANLEAMWAGFTQFIAQPLQQHQLPFAFTLGNHDASGALNDSGQFIFQTERKIAENYWQNQKQNLNLDFIDDQDFPFQYSFQDHDIFYAILDASTAQIQSQSLAGLKTRLASPQAQAAKRRIVMGHLPLFAVAVGRNKAGDILTQRDELQTLLEQHHVNLYISGHHHAYFPGKQGNLKFLHAGALGSGPRVLLNSNLNPRHTLTVVDIYLKSPENDIIYTTYDMKTLKVIQPQELPEKIEGYNSRWVMRDQNA